jgi:hypothetical protein
MKQNGIREVIADPETRNAWMSDPDERDRPEPAPPVAVTPPEATSPPGPDPAARWVAVGSLAAVVAALIAVLAYVSPRGTPAPLAETTPAPSYSAPAVTPTAPADNTPADTTPAQPTTTASASAAASIRAGTPAGCEDARAAITTYNQTAGSTTNSQANAALQAYDTLLPESTEAANEDISADISDVAEDFYVMNQIQTGVVQQSYPAAVQQVNSDIHRLSAACGFS